jgi:DNA-binding transcriptional LysR family regulator
MNIMHVEDLHVGQLLLLEALARTGTLTSAAEHVGMTQPAASHALARLRREMHDPLFVRTSSGMRPTPYGERLSKAVSGALGLLRGGLEGNPAFEPAASRRIFNVYMSDVGQMVFLPRLLAQLKSEAPGVTLRVRPVPSRAPHLLLESGEVDLAVGYFTSLKTGFYQARLFRERYVCAVRKDHPAFASGMTLEAFRSVPQALADSSGMAHELLEKRLLTQKVPRDVKLYVPQFMVLPLVIASSDLLVIMPNRLAEQFARLVRLKLMELPAKVPPYDIKMYWHERFRDDPANCWLRGLFTSLFAERQRAGMSASAR